MIELVAQKVVDAQEELVNAIINMCHVVGGPASGITREEATAAATLKDEMHTYKCATHLAYSFGSHIWLLISTCMGYSTSRVSHNKATAAATFNTRCTPTYIVDYSISNVPRNLRY